MGKEKTIPPELWIKVITLVAIITLPLVSTIGGFIIQGQNEMTAGQRKTNEELSKINGYLLTHENRISRTESDVKEISVKVLGNTERIYKLEGTR